MSRVRNMEPRELIARFDSKCAETGKVIRKGDACVYYPSSREVFHPESRQAQEYREMKADDLMSSSY